MLTQLSNGVSSEPGLTCPDYGLSAEVRYRTPAEEADDPPPGPEEGGGGEPTGEPGGPGAEGGTTPAAIPATPDAMTASSEGGRLASPEPGEANSYWRHCRGSLLTHLVSCRRGRQVLKRATAKLTRSRAARARGFSCLRPAGGLRSIVCRRGPHRILGAG